MVTNKKRSKLPFFLGVFVTLLICGGIIYFLLMQLTELKKEKEVAEDAKKAVYMLKTDVQAGATINSEDLILVQVSLPIAASRSGDIVTLMPETPVPGAAPTTYVKSSVSGQIAKIDLAKGTILTTDMVIEEDISDDLRMVEYNMIELPIQLEAGDFVDIRVTLPNAQDYLVVSKKRIENITENTIWMKMTEDEILVLSAAMVEGYVMKGSILYATRYVDIAVQEKLVTTYPVSDVVVAIMNANPNIIEEARAMIRSRRDDPYYKNNRNTVNNMLEVDFAEGAQKSIEDKVKEHVQKQQAERKEYLETLNTPPPAVTTTR